MPLYTYKCEKCGHEHDFRHSIHDKPPRKCPECGRNTLYQSFRFKPGIIFNGEGFYSKDNREGE